MKRFLSSLIVLVSHLAFANHVWIEKDDTGQDSRVHITINVRDHALFQSAFPKNLVLRSTTALQQVLEIDCNKAHCELI